MDAQNSYTRCIYDLEGHKEHPVVIKPSSVFTASYEKCVIAKYDRNFNNVDLNVDDVINDTGNNYLL